MRYIIIIFVVSVLNISPAFSQDIESDPVSPDNGNLSNHSMEYWVAKYHPQVTIELFKLVNYPYFEGGQKFAKNGPILIEQSGTNSQNKATDKNSFDSDVLNAISEVVAQMVTEQAAEAIKNQQQITEEQESIEPKAEDENSAGERVVELIATGDKPSGDDNEITNFRNYFETCSDQIYRWRQMNESPAFALELLRAIKITETESGIYQVNPDIAVQIRRTIGNINKINKNFDVTCRITMEAILAGEYPRSWLSRRDKQLADLRNRFILLKDLNDKGSQALGLGVIDRTDDQPRYSGQILFEKIEKPDKYEMK